MKLCLNACCRGRVLCENVVTKGIMINGSVMVSEVSGVSVLVVSGGAGRVRPES